MSSASRRFAEWLLRWRWILLGCGVVSGLLAYGPAQEVEFDRSIENMFAPDDPLVVTYRKLARIFGGNEVVLAVYQDRQLFHPDGSGLRRLSATSQRLSEVAGVKGVLSIDMPLGESIVDRESVLAERFRQLFLGYTHGDDGETVAIVCMLLPEAQAQQPRRHTIEQLRRIMADLPQGLSAGLLAGEPVMVADGFRYVQQDGRRLGIASTLLLSLTIIVCFRSIRWVVIPIAVVQLALVLTRATLWLSGIRLSMVSSMLTAVVTVVGVATVVHVIVRFRDARHDGSLPYDALLRAATLLALPILWACCTDAVGFASLTLAQVGPVRDFGLMMAIGSLMVIFSAATVIPGIALWGRWDTDPRQVAGERLLDAQLDRCVRLTRRYPKRVATGLGLVAAVASAGVFRLEVETDFTKNFRADSPIVRSYEMVETHLGGAGVLDVMIPAPSPLDWRYLNKVLHLEQRLRQEVLVSSGAHHMTAGLTKVISLADGLVAGALISIDNVPSGFLRRTVVRQGLAAIERQMPEFFQALYGEDPREPGQHYFRIMLRAHERQPSRAKRQVLLRVREISREEFPEAEVTGFFVLLTNLIDSIIRDQWLTFAVAVTGIGCMMIAAFRSVTLALVAIVPNSIPILVVMGLMGWLGLRINMGAAMIAAVSMGLSIDNSIHYITSFRRGLAEGKSLEDALDAVQHTVGHALVFSTLALIVGFSVLCASEFVPTVYFGFLVSLSMLGGLAGNLVVLPLLLSFVARDPRRSGTKRSW